MFQQWSHFWPKITLPKMLCMEEHCHVAKSAFIDEYAAINFKNFVGWFCWLSVSEEQIHND
jgi:hypothetical protein